MTILSCLKNMRSHQPGGGDGKKSAGFRIGFRFANYRGPHLTQKRYVVTIMHMSHEEYIKLERSKMAKMLENVIDGKFSGKPNGSYCYGEEKLRQVIKYCNKHNFDIQKTFYYADSFSDILVLESVGNPICVTPDKKLKKAAYRNGWPVYHW